MMDQEVARRRRRKKYRKCTVHQRRLHDIHLKGEEVTK
jgi:hypothetical protein